MIEYKGYFGQVLLDDESGLFHGEVVNTKDVITFQGKSVKELRRALKDSIEDYLDFCKERGEEPDKPFSGKFVLRISPELHQKIFIKAKNEGKSLNSWVTSQLSEVIQS